MTDFLHTLRKLVLGETWTLPIGVGAAVGLAALVRAAAGAHGWFHDAGGFVLLALVVAVAIAVTHARPGR